MATRTANFCANELTTAAVTQYTVPTNCQAVIRACSAANKTATARYVTVTLTPSGGSARNLVYQVVVPPNTMVVLYPVIAQPLDAGDIIQALAEANTAIDFVMGGSETF